MTTATKPRARSVATTAALAVVATGSIIGGAILPAGADTDVTSTKTNDAIQGVGVGHFRNLSVARQHWLGSFRTFGGNPTAWCLDGGRWNPRPAGDTTTGKALSWSKSSYNAPKAAYVLSMWGNTSDSYRAEGVAGYLLKSTELPHRPIGTQASPTSRGADYLSAMKAAAEKFAGPYQVPVNFLSHGKAGSTGTLSVGLLSAAKNYTPGQQIKVALSGDGDAVFTANGAKELTVTSAEEASKLTYRARSGGKVNAAVTVTAPGTTVPVYRANETQVQSVATRPQLATYQGADSTSFSRYAPQVTTKVARAQITCEPATLRDKVLVTGGRPNSTVTVKDDLYGPLAQRPAESADAPADAPLIKTVDVQVTLDENGNGWAWSEPVTVPSKGYYVWRERLLPTQVSVGDKGTYGNVDETTLVSTVTMKTQVQSKTVTSGSPLVDNVKFTSGHKTEGTLTASLWGPLALPAGKTCDDITKSEWATARSKGEISAVYTEKKAISGAGTFTVTVGTSGEAIAAPGCYGWSESYREALQTNRVVATSALGEVDEVSLVEAKPNQPVKVIPKKPEIVVINTGVPGDDRNSAGLLAGGALLTSALAGAGALMRRRKN